ncbi:PUA domain containing protein [Halorubrum sp. AJ67]|nr:PUA domain containing protein [Halorubrum sp. AJ67]
MPPTTNKTLITSYSIHYTKLYDEIDAFVPHGSVLAPGVVDADDGIRVGDEVVIEGPKAFAVGRAEMSGPEMAGSTRGVAVQVRHVDDK